MMSMQTRSKSRAKSNRVYYCDGEAKEAKRRAKKHKAANSGLKLHRFAERLVCALKKVDQNHRDKELKALKAMFHNRKEPEEGDEYNFCMQYIHHIKAENTTIQPKLLNARMIKTVFKLDGIDYVSTQESNINDAGIGLFAEKTFRKEEIIGVYFGDYVADIENGSKSGYQFLHMDVPILPDGAQERYFGCHFVNDPTFNGVSKKKNPNSKRNKKMKINAYLGNDYKLIASKEIKKGDEIFISYNFSTE